MIALIEDNRDAIVALCERFKIRRLALFGSAATGTFDPATSDLDFLVDLGEYDPGVGSRYLGLIVALEQLFGRHVDVVTEKAVKDPDFRRELDATAKVIYGTATSKTAA